MDKKTTRISLLQRYRELWYLVGEQPPWAQPIWKILLIVVPAFVAVDILLLLYVAAILILKLSGGTPPALW